VGRLTAWGGSRTASLCSMGGLTAWGGGLTTSFYPEHGRTAWERGQTASSGQWQEPRWNTRCR
jgi:hypothetical protein